MKEQLTFVPREHLFDYEWDFETKRWQRPKMDMKQLKVLNERKNGYSLFRLLIYCVLLGISAYGAIMVASINIWMAFPIMLFYYFIYGFLTAISHELRHKTILTKNFDALQEVMFFIIQTLMWQSPLYERTSHRLHHRYTMVRDNDPETDWPEVVTRKWLLQFGLKMLSRVFVIGALYYLIVDIYKQVIRVIGPGDKMMQKFCNEKEVKRIRVESLAILLIHIMIIAVMLMTGQWAIFWFITIAWQIGQVSASFYFYTEHLSKVYNANDQRLVTRSVKVGPLVKLLYWGLDDHIEHHIYPAVPSCNLPKLHKILKTEQDVRLNAWQCWREIYLIAGEKEERPKNEHIPEVIRETL